MADPQRLNPEVTRFLDSLDHPFRKEIELLRQAILSAGPRLTENVKWNAPNYSLDGHDLITMKIHPPKLIQVIFHRGAKPREQPQEQLIQDDSGLLVWKENDRAVATFKNAADIENQKAGLIRAAKDWMQAVLPNQ